MRRGDCTVRRRLAWPAIGMAAWLAACGTPPAVHLHTLMPDRTAAPTAAASMPASMPIVFTLDPIRLPAQVDQPQWLVQLGDGTLASLEQERWASPLRDEFQQAVLETLIVRYGFVELRHSADPVAAASSALRIAIDVRRFQSVPGREARIEGSWTISAAARSAASAPAPLHCEWVVRESAPGGMPALAEAHRRAVVRLTQGIGDAMIAMRRGAGAVCPKADVAG